MAYDPLSSPDVPVSGIGDGNLTETVDHVDQATSYTTTSAGSSTTIIDSSLPASGSYIGYAVVFAAGSSTDAGQSAVVTGYDPTSHTLTLGSGISSNTPSGASYMLIPPDRISQMFYDWQDRPVSSESGIVEGDTTTHRMIDYEAYDNLGEVLSDKQYDGTGVTLSDLGYSNGVPQAPGSGQTAETDYHYDNLGRVWKTDVMDIIGSTGTISTNDFYDADSNLIAAYTPGQPTEKYAYNGADELIATYDTDGGAVNNSGTPLTAYSDAETVSNDVVVSETDLTLDDDGNTILTTTKDRLATASDTTTGALNTTLASVGYVGDYYDNAGRETAEENVGTNGGTTWTRPTKPDASDATHLVTTMQYDPAGDMNLTIDPAGIESYDVFNMLGEETKTVAAYTGGSPGNSTDQTTNYIYDGDGDTVSMTAVDPASNNQTTDYIYGVSSGTGSTIASNDLLYKTEYPDASTGNASSSASDDIFLNYNDQGETIGMTDQNGTTHAYTLDPEGRLTLDAVTTLGSGVDGTVMALGYSYNDQGLPYQQTSYSNANGTGIVNQDQDKYNGLGQLTDEYQADSGAVSVGSTPDVQYVYNTPTAGSLPTEIVCPNLRILHIGYSGTALDTAIGRADFLADDNGSGGVGSHIADYTYQGLSSVITQADADGVTLTNTLDQFSRVDEMKWYDSGTSTTTDDFQFGYDQDSNILYEVNGVNSTFSQLFTYDDLNRLNSFGLGTLNGGHTAISTPNSVATTDAQSWTLDAVGNQTAVATNGGSPVANSQNNKNEITALASNSVAYDNDGNTTTDANGNTLTYDAWNHLVTDSAGTTSYSFNANGNRVTETQSGTTTDLYFTTANQVIEEDQSGTPTAQYVWGLDYQNNLIERDSGASLATRIYAQHDQVYNVTALVSSSGSVDERFTYTPYGVVTVLDPSAWTKLSADTYGWLYYFQGGRMNTTTGLLRFGARDFNPATGTWMEQDPDGYVNGANAYEGFGSAPVAAADPAGTKISVPAGQADAVGAYLSSGGLEATRSPGANGTVTFSTAQGKAPADDAVNSTLSAMLSSGREFQFNTAHGLAVNVGARLKTLDTIAGVPWKYMGEPGTTPTKLSMSHEDVLSAFSNPNTATGCEGVPVLSIAKVIIDMFGIDIYEKSTNETYEDVNDPNDWIPGDYGHLSDPDHPGALTEGEFITRNADGTFSGFALRNGKTAILRLTLDEWRRLLNPSHPKHVTLDTWRKSINVGIQGGICDDK